MNECVQVGSDVEASAGSLDSRNILWTQVTSRPYTPSACLKPGLIARPYCLPTFCLLRFLSV